MRELLWMVRGKNKNEWERLSALMAHMRNLKIGRNDRPSKPDDFNPYSLSHTKEEVWKIPKARQFSILKSMFVK